MGVLLPLVGLVALARGGSATLPHRPSQGRGRDAPLHLLREHTTHACIEPPPPIGNGFTAAAAAVAASPPPKHLQYLGLDGDAGGDDTKGWANLAFLPLAGSEGQGPGVNETAMNERLAQGYDLLLDAGGITVVQCEWTTNLDVVRTVAGSPPRPFVNDVDAPPKSFHCADKWRRAWFGNSTVGGVWNNTVKRLADEKKIIGVYVGDELLGGEITIST